MMAWVVRVLLAAGAVATQWFVAPTDPNFGVTQGIVSIVLFAAVVFIVALWPWWPRRKDDE